MNLDHNQPVESTGEISTSDPSDPSGAHQSTLVLICKSRTGTGQAVTAGTHALLTVCRAAAPYGVLVVCPQGSHWSPILIWNRTDSPTKQGVTNVMRCHLVIKKPGGFLFALWAHSFTLSRASCQSEHLSTICQGMMANSQQGTKALSTAAEQRS